MLQAMLNLRTMLIYAVAPTLLGLTAAGAFAFVAGWHDAAVTALVVGAACSVVVGVLLCIVALVAALTALYKAVACLWHVVQRMLDYFDDMDPSDGNGGDLELDPDEAEIIYDVTRVKPRITPTLN